MPDFLMQAAQLTTFPVLVLVVYIAYKAGHMADRLENLSTRVERLEEIHLERSDPRE